ncbi:YunG family protein [Nocardia jiangsuensis]
MLESKKPPVVDRYGSTLVGAQVPALHRAIRSAWSVETSAAADWREDNRAEGQCAVSACVLQDYRGGGIRNTAAPLPAGRASRTISTSSTGEIVDLSRERPRWLSHRAPLRARAARSRWRLLIRLCCQHSERHLQRFRHAAEYAQLVALVSRQMRLLVAAVLTPSTRYSDFGTAR